MVKMPALYAAILAILVRSAGIHLEHTFLWPVLTHFNGAFIVLVTVTIGLQLHRSKLRKPDRFILATSFNKLILCPAIAWGVLTLFGGAFYPDCFAGILHLRSRPVFYGAHHLRRRIR